MPHINNKMMNYGVEMQLQCTKCQRKTHIRQMITTCDHCNSALEYVLSGSYSGMQLQRNDLWRYFPLLPLEDQQNIISLGEGDSEIIELPELSERLHHARLFLKLDCTKNPTGTFKDREASIIISRCKELQLDHLVFYSTGNTGRAYTHYAASVGLTTYFFMPKECSYKNTAQIRKNKNNFIIFVDAHYPQISGYAKKFASLNNLTAIAPLHDRTECYTTLAYEQYQQMPDCDYFVQTIASGMGPIGFVKGHQHLIKFGLETPQKMPRVICVQSQETNFMYQAYRAGKQRMTEADLPSEFADNLFEPTLNSTNPVNNYPALYSCLQESNGLITDAAPQDVLREGEALLAALQRRNIQLRNDLEQSIMIGYTGLVKLAAEGHFSKGERLLLLGTGRGHDTSHELLAPDITVNLHNDDPVDVMRHLQRSAQ